VDAEQARPAQVHPTEGSASSHDPRHLRDCLGMFATGVTIVTTQAADGGFIGLTANSFNSLSLDPPLVLWSLGVRAGSRDTFLSATHFAVNVLSTRQLPLAMRFARAGTNRFAGVSVHAGLGGAPLIDGALAWFECETRTHYRHGDHLLFIGEVKRCARAQGSGLVFQQGGFGVAGPIAEEPRE
jgi:flavin reductase (DIM6/NTAB) family NADH-FMN oxidoreductase RutF